MKKNSFFIHADGCNVRARGGFTQIWCSDPFEPMVISGLSCNFGPRLPFPRSPFLISVSRSPFSVLRFPFPVSRFPFPVPRSSFLVARSSFSVPHSPFLILRSSFSIPSSPFLVLSSSFFVLSSSLSVACSKFTIPCSLFLDLRCPHSVLCWSNIPPLTIQQWSVQTTIAVRVLIGKKNI